MKEIIFALVWLAIVSGALWLLWFIIRFSIIAPRRLRGRESRLRNPELDQVEARWNVKLPAVLTSIFREHPIIERSEFYLAPTNCDQEDQWLFIYSFVPLTVLDVHEEKTASRVPGIPIAYGGDGRTYYLASDAAGQSESQPVMLSDPQIRQDAIAVASSVEQFFSYTPRDVPDDDE